MGRMRWLTRPVFFVACTLLLLTLSSSDRTGEATSPAVALGRWINYSASALGFPVNYPIAAVAVDGQERLWIGTRGGGVAVYDGILWTRYIVADGLASDFVNAIAVDGNEVWVGTTAGVSVFDVSAFVWTTYTTANSGLPNNNVRAIAFSNTGASPNTAHFQYFATPFGLAQFWRTPDPDFWFVYTTANTSLASNNIHDLAFDAGGALWIATGSGVNRVVGSTWTTFNNASTPGCGIIQSATRVAIDDKGKRVWFGTDRSGDIDPLPGLGACLFDTAASTWQRFHSGNSGLADDTVKDLAVDAEGRVWFATQTYNSGVPSGPGGVYVCTWVNTICYWKAYATTAGLASQQVLAAGASADRVWFGTADAGLSSFALHWSFFDTDGVLALASEPGKIWVGTGVGLKRFSPTLTIDLAGQEISAILPLTTADLWAGSNGGGAFWWNGTAWQNFTTANSGLASNKVLALARDGKGRLWLGTDDAGVSVYHPASKGWATFNTSNSPLPANRVAALAVDAKGDVWVGTSGGLGRYKGNGWNVYTTAHGLPNPDIRALAVDKLGNVWAATGLDAARWNGSTWTTYALSPYIGGGAALAVDAAGDVWLGGSAGAAVYNGSSWRYYRARNSGLTNQGVRAITTDADGGVWFGAIHSVGMGGTIQGGLFARGTFSEPLGLPSPTLASFNPTSGPVETEVILVGTNFDARGPAYNKVEFQAWGYNQWAPAPVLSVSGTTTVTTRVPAAAAVGSIRLKTAGGAGTSSTNFNPLPSISSINPISAVVGAPVDIYGSNFEPSAQARFGNSSWVSLHISQTYNHIRTYVPSDATTGPVQVRTAAGTGTSAASFTVGSGGLKLLGWEVHQGVPIGTLLVAGKSTVVRVYLGTSDPVLPAYAARGLLRVYRDGFSVFTVEGDVPNNGWFANKTIQYTRGGSIDFVIPGSQLPAGMYLFQLESPLGFSFGTAYHLITTSDLRLHASAPGPAPNAAQTALLQRQLAALARTYPVRDGWGDLGSNKGVQYTLRSYAACDGTQKAYCNGTGYLWDYWQQNAAGQRQALTQINDRENATDDGSKLTWSIGKVEKGKDGQRRFMARLRPAALFPVGTTNIATTAIIDSPDQAGSPDDTASVSFAVTRAGSGGLSVGDASPALAGQPGLAGDGARPAAVAPAAAVLDLSAQVALLYDADANSVISPGDVVQFRLTYQNLGDVDVDNTTLVIDYDQNHLAVHGSGGLMQGTGNTFATRLIPGQFYVPQGWLPSKHDPPLDENYNGVIDAGDMVYYVAEFDDWDPTTGNIVVSTDLSKLNPGEVIRNFRDDNRNGKRDGSEALSQSVQRGDNVDAMLWNIPWGFMTDYNKTAPAGKKAEFSALWFWKGVNAFMGPGQGSQPGYKTWADVDDNTSILHELGHNIGEVEPTSPHRTPGGHSTNSRLVGVPVGYDLVGRRPLTTTQMLSIMFPNVQWPLEDAFFEPYEYFDIYTFLRFHQGPSAAVQAAANGGPYFAISGVVTRSGQAQITSSFLASGIAPTDPDAASEYQVVFLAGNAELGSQRFPVQFWTHDRGEHDKMVEVDSAAFDVIAAFPSGTTAVEIRRGTTTLARLQASSAAPQVSVLTPNGGESFPAGSEELAIRWSASDADGDLLTYAVRFSADSGASWRTLSVAGTTTFLTVPLGLLPGSSQALVEVEASDGFNTGSDRSNAIFTVGKKAPLWAGIVAPTDGDRLVQSQRVMLAGSGYDLEDGTLASNALAWQSDRDGFLGRGELISASLTVGKHVITLTASDGDGLSASHAITVELLADFDGDGLADEFEKSQGGLSWWNADDAGADPDGDGLTNQSEAAWGTDPARADSDGDGVSDGDEVTQGSLPAQPASVPQAAQLQTSRTALSFTASAGGGNPPAQQLLLASNRPEGLAWTATTNVAWLSVSPISGTTPAAVQVSVSVAGLAPGAYTGQVTFRSGSSERVMSVTLAYGSAATPPTATATPTATAIPGVTATPTATTVPGATATPQASSILLPLVRRGLSAGW